MLCCKVNTCSSHCDRLPEAPSINCEKLSTIDPGKLTPRFGKLFDSIGPWAAADAQNVTPTITTITRKVAICESVTLHYKYEWKALFYRLSLLMNCRTHPGPIQIMYRDNDCRLPDNYYWCWEYYNASGVISETSDMTHPNPMRVHLKLIVCPLIVYNAAKLQTNLWWVTSLLWNVW